VLPMKIQTYKQLTEKDRETLYALLGQGHSLRKIALTLGRNVSTISREIQRNRHLKLGEYLPDTANRKHAKRKLNGRKQKFLEKDDRLKRYIVDRLMEGWTPQLIAGRMEREMGYAINHETIYQYIYSKEGRRENLRQYLPRAHRLRRKKNGRKTQKGKIPNRVDISQRPASVEGRRTFGHWEGDSVLYKGHSQALATQVERKTRYVLLGKPKTRSAMSRNKTFKAVFQPLPPKARKTLTLDNGTEFAAHEKVRKSLEIKIFFAKPYSSWQRGTNEWKNGLLRRFIPHGVDISKMRMDTIRRVQDLMNDRPMKCLGYCTPKEMFFKELQKLSLRKKLRRKRRSVALRN